MQHYPPIHRRLVSQVITSLPILSKNSLNFFTCMEEKLSKLSVAHTSYLNYC